MRLAVLRARALNWRHRPSACATTKTRPTRASNAVTAARGIYGSFAFHGERLRLAKVALGLSLEQLGTRVSATRQYLNQLEQGIKAPTKNMRDALADALGVGRHFFGLPADPGIRPEQCHFRKQRTTPLTIVSQVLARGTLLDGFVSRLDRELDLPKVSFPDIPVSTLHEVEDVVNAARAHWQLGTGPISSMMRVVENAGAVVSFFGGDAERVDALSIDTVRPMIIRSDAKQAACRLRFDLGHETGHLIMHRGVQTGDKETEDQANRFASAFLLPRSSFVHEFSRSRFFGLDAHLRAQVKVEGVRGRNIAPRLRSPHDLCRPVSDGVHPSQ